MYNNLRVAAVVAAGGKGSRMRAGVAKQFLPVGGRPIIAVTLETFIQNPLTDEIVVVLPDGDREYFLKNVCSNVLPEKLKCIVSGGATRQESVYKGLVALSRGTDIVLIHDAVRPFAGQEIINAAIAAAAEYKSCVPAVKVKDTVKSAEDGFVASTPDRETLYAIQTPQGFDYNMIVQAHERAACDNFPGTDDSTLAERIGIPTKIIEGSYQNIKITTEEDLWYAEAILRYQMNE